MPSTPASRLAKSTADPEFRTKPQLAVELIQAAPAAKIPFRAVVADCFDGDNTGFVEALDAAGVALVLALKPRKGTWAAAEAAPTPVEAAGELGWQSRGRPGQWRRIRRRFGDGHTEVWWAADAALGGWGPQGPHRLVVATTDPRRLPGHSTWYLLANLPRPVGRRAQAADLAQIVGAYGWRNRVEQGYKQVKGELGWADFQVTGDRAIRRHWTLVGGAFSLCWHAGQAEPAPAAAPPPSGIPAVGLSPAVEQVAARGAWERLDPDRAATRRRRGRVLAAGVASSARLAGPVVWLQRCWRGWSTSPPPRQLQQALEWVRAGQPIDLYLPP